MMKKRVKPYEVKGLFVLINIVDSLYCSEEVETIREDLLDMLKKPTDYTCLSQDDIDSIFKPKNEDWADTTKTGHAYGAIKPVFKIIKNLMFEDDSNCKEVYGAENF